jgi:uncharacterized membrane protein
MVLEYRHLLKGNKITMKNASKTMFNIGNIFTIIYIGLGALLLLIGIIACIVGGIGLAGANGDSQAEAAAAAALGAGGGCIGWGIYFLVTSIVCLVLVKKAKRELADESKSNKKPFIVTIVVGAIASNVFYVLAGIFGLIAEGQQGQQQAE